MTIQTLTAEKLFDNIENYPEQLEINVSGNWYEIDHIENRKIVNGAWVSDGLHIYITCQNEQWCYELMDLVKIRWNQTELDLEQEQEIELEDEQPDNHTSSLNTKAIYLEAYRIFRKISSLKKAIAESPIGELPTYTLSAALNKTYQDLVSLEQGFGNLSKAAEQHLRNRQEYKNAHILPSRFLVEPKTSNIDQRINRYAAYAGVGQPYFVMLRNNRITGIGIVTLKIAS